MSVRKPGITINTDASWHPLKKAAGYAYFIVTSEFKLKGGGVFKTHPKSPTDAEIMAFGNAFTALLSRGRKDPPDVSWLILNTDSKHGIERVLGDKDALAAEVHDLWKEMKRRFNLKWMDMRHVKAHSGKDDARSYVNEWCDTEAKSWMRRMANGGDLTKRNRVWEEVMRSKTFIPSQTVI